MLRGYDGVIAGKLGNEIALTSVFKNSKTSRKITTEKTPHIRAFRRGIRCRAQISRAGPEEFVLHGDVVRH